MTKEPIKTNYMTSLQAADNLKQMSLALSKFTYYLLPSLYISPVLRVILNYHLNQDGMSINRDTINNLLVVQLYNKIVQVKL